MNQIEQNAFFLIRIAGDLDTEDLLDNRVRDESGLSQRDFDKAVRYLTTYGYIEDYPSAFVLTMMGEMKYQDLKEAMKEPKQLAPAAFLSYAHFDDEHSKGTLTEFGKHLSAEMRAQTGEQFVIFQDKEHVEWGQNWRRRIDETIGGTTFLIPVITPSFFKSPECRAEVDRFLKREQELRRDDLVLPLYFIDTQLMNDDSRKANDLLAERLASHQYADWRALRFEPFGSPSVRKALEKLAIQLRNAVERAEAFEGSTVRDVEKTPAPSGLQPPNEEKGLVEAQQAARQLFTLLPQIGRRLNDSTESVNKRIDQLKLNGSPQDGMIAALIAADMNSCTVAIDKWLAELDEHIGVFIDFFSGYIPELDAAVEDDRHPLTAFREEFVGNSETLETALRRIRSSSSSGSKLRISSEVIRAGKRRAEALTKLVSSMERLRSFFVNALQTIDDKLRG